MAEKSRSPIKDRRLRLPAQSNVFARSYFERVSWHFRDLRGEWVKLEKLER